MRALSYPLGCAGSDCGRLESFRVRSEFLGNLYKERSAAAFATSRPPCVHEDSQALKTPIDDSRRLLHGARSDALAFYEDMSKAAYRLDHAISLQIDTARGKVKRGKVWR